MTLPIPDASRLAALRRMKLVATGLIVAAAVIFLGAVLIGDGKGAWGYLQAASEAAMVGGLADWFAVTALFRHPLGIPIPHTAIIPRKKDQIGAGLATFVQRHFLTGEVIGERLLAADVPGRAGIWLAKPEHAARVADEVAAAFRAGAALMNDDDLRAAVGKFADQRLREIDVAPVAARILDAMIGAGEHQVALASGLRGLLRFLENNKEVFRERVYEESPEWVPRWVDDRVFDRGYAALRSFLADVEGDPEHALRQDFDRQLRAYSQKLRVEPERAERLEQVKLSLLDHPEVRGWIAQFGITAKTTLLANSADPASDLRRTATRIIARGAETLRHDEPVRAKVNSWLLRAVQHVLTSYGDDIAELISGTVARWDAEETGRRLELQVGRDLQFIRVNGTVVGSLVGLVIYTVSRFL